MQDKTFYVYILTNPGNTVLYTGVSNDISRRLETHLSAPIDSFTKRYHIQKLVYVETFSDAYSAISREKQIKAGSRRKKIELIEKVNPQWDELTI